MLTIVLVVTLLSLGAAVVMYLLIRPPLNSVITYALVALVLVGAVLVAPLSYKIAHYEAQRGAIGGFHQFLNGSIVSVHEDIDSCSRDGSCAHDYACDPYLQMHTRTVSDGNGKSHTETYYTTEYHSCPYATKEYTFTATDSIGIEHTLASDIFSANPEEWRSGHGLPGNVQRGVPPLWQTMSDAIKQGNLYPVTDPSTYDNYILADQDTLLRAHSDDIDKLKKLKLLPDHTRNLHDPVDGSLSADKVSFVGVQPGNAAAWQQTLMYFNAALGMKLQGDMHVVIVKASLLNGMDPHNYLLGLKAYWLNDLGKYALPKNGIMLILGVDDAGTTVQWSQADTGMPLGNGSMLSALSDLNGVPFTTTALFGNTTAQLDSSSKPQYTIGSGKVPQIVMNEFPFERACMKCTSKADATKHQQGFTYLSTELPVPTSYIVWTIFFDILLLTAMWGTLFWFASTETSLESDSPFRRTYKTYV